MIGYLLSALFAEFGALWLTRRLKRIATEPLALSS
jgi:hypothetical protein